MHIRRLKIVVAIYLVCFLTLLYLVPMDVTFTGTPSNNLSVKPTTINYGIVYRPLTDMWGEKDTTAIIYGQRFKGHESRRLAKEVLVLEFVGLSVLFLGLAFIVGKKENG